MNVETRVLMTIRRNRLWEPKEPVVLAVSGGVDSMVLLYAIHQTVRSHKGVIQVVTFDHGLREESKQEVMLVKKMATELGIPCDVHQLNMKKGSNLQNRAREKRRSVLESYTGVIATAHHASDQAETVLFRLLRGSGLDGLKGMTHKTGRWVKPLLDMYKPDVIAYAEKRNITWMEDRSNESTTRGQIRSLWPSLELIRPQPEKALVRVGQSLSRDSDLIAQLVEQQLPLLVNGQNLNVQKLRKQHEAIQIRVIEHWLWFLGVTPSHQQLNDLLTWFPKRNGQQFSIEGDKRIQSRNGMWFLCGG